MQKRYFESLGDEVSLLGFGCMRFKTIDDTQNIDEEYAQTLIDRAIAGGVNYFDTAHGYHEGLSQPFIGRALKKYPRETFYLATKMPPWQVKTLDDGIRIFERQLALCQVDYFDYYLCHALANINDFKKKFIETGLLAYLHEQKSAGRIRHFGFSFHGSVEELEWLTGHYKWDFVQLQLNYLDWGLQNARTQYEILRRHDLPCIVMEPVRGGRLASLCDEAAEVLKKERPDASVASWAIRFAASLPGVLTVLSGMGDMEQVVDNCRTLTEFSPLSEREREVLREAVDIYMSVGSIPCTGCRYCMDCPAGVDIPGVFSVYNECAAAHQLSTYLKACENGYFADRYALLPEPARANACIDCKKCVKACPQGINIPAKMREIHAISKL